MKKLTYQAVFEPTPQGTYSVYFPDLSGCITLGKTLADAQTQAIDALRTHVCGMEELGLDIPPPSPCPTANPETESGYSIHPVTIFPDLLHLELDNEPVPQNITIPHWLKCLAEEKQVNFSQLMELALLEYLDIPQTCP